MNLSSISKRTVVIFTVFIVVAILGSLFIYHFSNYTDLAVKKYVEELTVCEDLLSAQGCFAIESCVGIYGPSCPGCEDSEFKYCQKVPANVEAAIVKNKKLCEQTQGEWYRNKLGNFCLCDRLGENRMFDKKIGCVTK